MYPGSLAKSIPDKPAYIMANGGEVVTYGQLDEASNRAAQLFWSLGLRPGDHIAFCLENHPRFFEICWAAQRSGLYFTAISSRLTPTETEYIVDDSGAQIFVTSSAKGDLAEELLGKCPGLKARFMTDNAQTGYASWEEATANQPAEPLEQELEGAQMLYSSGTTGRPKGVKHPLSHQPAGSIPPLLALITAAYGATEDSVYLSPAPLYHAAPLAYNMAFQRVGATSVCTVVALGRTGSGISGARCTLTSASVGQRRDEVMCTRSFVARASGTRSRLRLPMVVPSPSHSQPCAP